MDVPVELSRILVSELGDQQIIFLQEKDGDRSFPIVIGISEALAIERRLKKIPTIRPMTHDLLAKVIEVMGGKVVKIVINDLRKLADDHPEQTFIATLHIMQDRHHVMIDSRPSDAIALGVALGTPIYVAEEVLEAVSNNKPSLEDRLEILRRRLEMLGGRIEEISRRLNDEAFISGNSASVIQEHRRMLGQMESEYNAIAGILKKFK